MSRVIAITLLENCLDSSWVTEFSLDGSVDERLMNYLAQSGTLKYYPHFPRPYFRIEHSGKFVIQGVINNQTMRVTFSPKASAQTEMDLRDHINRFDEN